MVFPDSKAGHTKRRESHHCYKIPKTEHLPLLQLNQGETYSDYLSVGGATGRIIVQLKII